MAWPPALVCRRAALTVFGLALIVYVTLSGLFFAAGLDARATVIAAQLIGLLGLALILARLMRLPLEEAFSLRPAGAAHWNMVVAAAVPLQLGGGALQFLIQRRLPDDSPWRRAMEETLTEFVQIDSGLDLLLLFLAAIVTAAICEEFLFRGLILQLLRRRGGWTAAIATSAALFAVFHLNPIVLVPVGLVGAYLAVLVWRSGSLYPAILAHALNNAFALFGLPLLLEEATYERWAWGVLGVSTLLFGYLLSLYLRHTDPPDV